MADTTSVVTNAITALIQQRDYDGDADAEVTLDSRLFEDLRLDSLELAELSSALGEVYGRDPYTEGLAPETVADVVAFYDG